MTSTPRNVLRLIVFPTLMALLGAIDSDNDGFQTIFHVKASDFKSSGHNDYFILEPNYQLVYEGTEDGQTSRLVVTVLDETHTIDGVETRVIEEYESLGKDVTEISRNYFALDQQTSDVYYFGEDVDSYKDGKISGHAGSWQSGKANAHFGLFMPAKPSVGYKFAQEIAPQVAMDRAEIVEIDAKQSTPAGDFKHCINMKETSPLELKTVEYKLYAPGIGSVVDDEAKLIKYGFNVEKRQR